MRLAWPPVRLAGSPTGLAKLARGLAEPPMGSGQANPLLQLELTPRAPPEMTPSHIRSRSLASPLDQTPRPCCPRRQLRHHHDVHLCRRRPGQLGYHSATRLVTMADRLRRHRRVGRYRVAGHGRFCGRSIALPSPRQCKLIVDNRRRSGRKSVAVRRRSSCTVVLGSVPCHLRRCSHMLETFGV